MQVGWGTSVVWMLFVQVHRHWIHQTPSAGCQSTSHRYIQLLAGCQIYYPASRNKLKYFFWLSISSITLMLAVIQGSGHQNCGSVLLTLRKRVKKNTQILAETAKTIQKKSLLYLHYITKLVKILIWSKKISNRWLPVDELVYKLLSLAAS